MIYTSILIHALSSLSHSFIHISMSAHTSSIHCVLVFFLSAFRYLICYSNPHLFFVVIVFCFGFCYIIVVCISLACAHTKNYVKADPLGSYVSDDDFLILEDEYARIQLKLKKSVQQHHNGQPLTLRSLVSGLCHHHMYSTGLCFDVITNTRIPIVYVYVCIHVCMCVCVCVRLYVKVLLWL